MTRRNVFALAVQAVGIVAVIAVALPSSASRWRRCSTAGRALGGVGPLDSFTADTYRPR